MFYQALHNCMAITCLKPVNSSLLSPQSDSDGIRDTTDNCPNTANPDQADTDKDGQGEFLKNLKMESI